MFEISPIPLAQWLLGFHMIARLEKGVSDLQLQRKLDLGSCRSAWHIAHRTRHTMLNYLNPPKLPSFVEADATHVGGKLHSTAGKPRIFKDRATRNERQAAQRARRERCVPVAVPVSRNGQARARVLDRVTGKNLKAFMAANVDASKSALHTEELHAAKEICKVFSGGHHAVNHSQGEYARGSVYSNTAVSHHSLPNRAINGAWHQISREHIQRYLNERASAA